MNSPTIRPTKNDTTVVIAENAKALKKLEPKNSIDIITNTTMYTTERMVMLDS
jgi:hypothetical protein